MGSITARMIAERAQKTLLDEYEGRFTLSELVGYLSDGQRETVILRPAAYAVNESVQLAVGTKQSIPSHGLSVIAVSRNMGGDGNTPGKVVRQMKRTDLDSTRPEWHMEDPDPSVRHWMFDDRDPKHFYVWPPQPSPPNYVELIYAAAPPEIVDEDAPISLDDAYQTPLYYYVMSRALSKRSTTYNPQTGQMYYSMFHGIITGRMESSMLLHPNQHQDRVERKELD